MGSVEAKSGVIDAQALQDTMRRGVMDLAQAKLGFARIQRLQERLDVDAVTEAQKLFENAGESSVEKALADARPGRQVTRAAYAGLVLSGRDRYLSEAITAWRDRDDVKAFMGGRVTLRAVETRGEQPDMSFDETTIGLADGSHISGTITGLSIVHGGTIMLREGEYAIYDDFEETDGCFEEGSVSGIFTMHQDVAEARAIIEPGQT